MMPKLLGKKAPGSPKGRRDGHVSLPPQRPSCWDPQATMSPVLVSTRVPEPTGTRRPHACRGLRLSLLQTALCL